MSGRVPRAALGWTAIVVAVGAISLLLVRGRIAAIPAAASEPPVVSGSAAARALAPVLRPATLPVPAAVTLLRDPASVQWYSDTLAYDRALARWKEELEAVGASVTVRAPAELARGRDPVVAAAAPCLSATARAALLAAARDGRGVLATWLTGTRDHGCGEAGWGFVAELTGAGRADTIPSTGDAYVIVPAGSALGIDVPPGARLELLRANHVALRTAHRAAHWGDDALNPLPVGGRALLDAAAATGERPRVAYLGFEPGAVVPTAWNRGIAQLLLRNAVAHIAGIALAAPEPWPRGARAAAVLAQDVEDQYANAAGALDTLRAARAPGTFFVVSGLARAHPGLTRDLASHGELGTHTAEHRVLGGHTRTEQARRLARTQQDLLTLAGQRVGGLRPPEERFDAATLAAWRAAGGEYVFAANDGRCACPELVEVPGAPMVLLGRIVDDDFITVRRARIEDPARLAADQLAAWEKVRALGGLYIMSYHSNMLARPATVGALGTVARALRADDEAWLTTTGEVARWWAARHLVRTAARVTGDSLAVDVVNGSDRSLLPFMVRVTVPDGRRLAAAGADAPAAGLARIRVPALAAGTTHRVVVALEVSRAR